LRAHTHTDTGGAPVTGALLVDIVAALAALAEVAAVARGAARRKAALTTAAEAALAATAVATAEAAALAAAVGAAVALEGDRVTAGRLRHARTRQAVKRTRQG
jgi:hypothetical protein